MEEQKLKQFVLEVQDRIGDMMAAVQVLTPLIRETGKKSDLEYLEAIQKSFYRLVRLLHNAKVCIRETTFCPGSMDLAGLCMRLGKECEDIAEILKIQYTWELAEGSVLSYGDDYLLQLAILNLLTNAFEAAGPGGSVTLKGKLVGSCWKVTVEDDGPGLRQAAPAPDPFLKVPGGAGFGLDTVQRVAELHEGSLLWEDKKEGGVRAVLSLPVKRVEGAPKPTNDLRDGTGKDPWGGFSPQLVEFSALLPLEEFTFSNTD